MTRDRLPIIGEPSNGDVLITPRDGNYLISVVPHDPLVKFKYLYHAVEFAKRFADTKGCAATAGGVSGARNVTVSANHSTSKRILALSNCRFDDPTASTNGQSRSPINARRERQGVWSLLLIYE